MVYLGQAQQNKVGLMPACTPLNVKTSRGKVNLRDPNKSWPKFKLSSKDYEQLARFSNFTTCVESVAVYDNRYKNVHLTSINAGNLMPGMPSEFALMMLGPPSQPPSVTSYLDPATGQPKSYSFFVWNNHKKTKPSWFSPYHRWSGNRCLCSCRSNRCNTGSIYSYNRRSGCI